MVDATDVKNFSQAYLAEGFKNNTKAQEFIHEKGVNRYDAMEAGVGFCDGDLYKTCTDEFGKDGKCLDSMIQAGIAHLDSKGRIFPLIKSGMITFPAYLGKDLSWWVLRNISGVSAPASKHANCLFYNQNAMENREFWIVHEPWDVIVLRERFGIPAIATDIWPKLEHISAIQKLAEIPVVGTEGTIVNKTVHICFEAGRNSMGRKSGEWMAFEICDFHKTWLYALPGRDTMSMVIGRGDDPRKVQRRHITKKPCRVYQKQGKYFYRSNAEQSKVISNFIVIPHYVMIDCDNRKTYQVKLIHDGKEFGPFDMDASHWKSQSSFTEWCGRCDGRMSFYGLQRELLEAKDYWFQHETRSVRKYAGLGRVEDNLWLFDDGCIYNGKSIPADDDRICWLPPNNPANAEGVQTTERDEVKFLKLPQDTFSMDEIIENIAEFWPMRQLFWTMLGFATATVFFEEITHWAGCMPVCFCQGPGQSGKTVWSRTLAALTGSGPIETPAGLSTNKSFARYISHHRSLALVFNEFEGIGREALINSFYDLDPPMRAQYTSDTRTEAYRVNTSACLTSVNRVTRPDRVSRLVLLRFNEWKDRMEVMNAEDPTRSTKFQQIVVSEGIRNNRFAGFMLALIKTDCGEKIINYIEKTQNLITRACDTMGSRQNLVYSIVFGSFLAAVDALDLIPLFKKYHIEIPDQENLAATSHFLGSGNVEQMKEEDEIATLLQILLVMADMEKHRDNIWIHTDTDGEKHLCFAIGYAYQEAKERCARMRDHRLMHLSQSSVRSRMVADVPGFCVKTIRNPFCSRIHRAYIVPFSGMESAYNIDTEGHEDARRKKEESRTEESGTVGEVPGGEPEVLQEEI